MCLCNLRAFNKLTGQFLLALKSNDMTDIDMQDGRSGWVTELSFDSGAGCGASKMAGYLRCSSPYTKIIVFSPD